MYVEDKVSHRGPFSIEVIPEQTVAELKKQVEKEFEIPVDYQKWILGKELVTNENSTLKDHNITTEGCPVFLYLVAPDPKAKVDRAKSPRIEDKNSPSTSKIVTPSNETTATKEENVSPLPFPKSSNEEKIEKMKMNVQNLQNKLNENRHNVKIIEITTPPPTKVVVDKKNTTQTAKVLEYAVTSQPITVVNTQSVEGAENTIITQASKLADHTPKIVNVIPKENKPKGEILIPITIEQSECKVDTNPKSVLEKRMSVTEIKIEQKPTPYKKENKDIKQKIDYDFPKAQSPTRNSDINVKPKLLTSTQEVPNNSVSTQKSDINVINLKAELPVQKVQNITEKKVPPKAKEEDMDDYDSKTLKPSKEWECHLCTLLNPISSNICAVCATVKLTKAHLPKKSVKKKAPQPKIGETSAKKEQTYLQLVNLDNADLVENVEPFECVVCFLEVPPHAGVTLRECLHQFCKICLGHTIEYTEEAEVKCPYRDDDYSCNIALQDREIKALVSPVVYEQHLAKSVAQAENKMDKSFHCKTPDCRGWCIFEDNVNEFRCPVCRKTNCLTCQAIHIGMNCKQYQEKMNQESEIDDDAKRTKQMLEEMVNRGEAIECPTCKVILMKKWGCDWLRCSMCKTEICWVTRGPRWGPAGKGDTSGGCQCGVNGVKCHPKCNYCH